MLTLITKLIIVFLLVSYLPLISYSFFLEQRKHRNKEVHLLMEKVKLESGFASLHTQDTQGRHLLMAVIFVSCVSFFGLSALFFGYDLNSIREPNLLLGGIHVARLAAVDSIPLTTEITQHTQELEQANKQSIFVYQQQALFVFSMAFLGAYLWGLQHFSRRYFMKDLVAGAYYAFAIRMVFSAVIALLIYHSIDLLVEKSSESAQKLNNDFIPALLPAVAFFIGMFPQKGMKWLTSKLNFMDPPHSSIKDLPLSMIEGFSEYHIYRLEESGIDNCYNLATADFITLLLQTPYDSREIIDWILQAKLCVRFGEDISILRVKGFRTVLDLMLLDDATITELAKDSALIESQLRRIIAEVQEDSSLKRLLEVGNALEAHCFI